MQSPRLKLVILLRLVDSCKVNGFIIRESKFLCLFLPPTSLGFNS